jgi:hypothetical protein
VSDLPDPTNETTDVPSPPRDRRHPAQVTADRLRSALSAYEYDLTPREIEAAAVILAGLYRVAGSAEGRDGAPEG